MPNPTVKEVSQGSNLRWGDNGLEDTLVYVVTRLEGSTSKKRYDAVLTTGIPQRGQAHPYIPGLVARSCPGVEMPKGHEFARITITFAIPEDGTTGGGGGGDPKGSGIGIRLGSIYERVSSNYAVNLDGARGPAIRLSWDASALVTTQDTLAAPAINENLNTVNTQVGTVGNLIARPTLTFTGKTNTHPLGKSLKVGWTNADDWLSGIAGRFDQIPVAMKEPDTWMLIRQSSSSKDGEQSIDIEREVAFRADKWLGVATFIDPATGRPPANIGSVPNPPTRNFTANGVKVVGIAGQAQFADLLSF